MSEEETPVGNCRKCGGAISQAHNRKLYANRGDWFPCEGAANGCDFVQRNMLSGAFEEMPRAVVTAMGGRVRS